MQTTGWHPSKLFSEYDPSFKFAGKLENKPIILVSHTQKKSLCLLAEGGQKSWLEC